MILLLYLKMVHLEMLFLYKDLELDYLQLRKIVLKEIGNRVREEGDIKGVPPPESGGSLSGLNFYSPPLPRIFRPFYGPAE